MLNYLGFVLSSLLFFWLVLYLYCKLIKYKFWQSRDVYSPPATFPFGHTLPVVSGQNNIAICFAEIYKDIKSRGIKYAGIYSMFKPVFLPLDPVILKHILVKDFSSFMDRGFFINENVDPISGHLFSLGGQKWKDLRAKLSPTFTSGKMKMMFSIIKNIADEMIELLESYRLNDESFDAKEIFSRYTTDVIGSCAFGLDCSSLKNPEDKFRKMCQKTFDPTTYESIKFFYAGSYSTILKLFNARLINKEIADFFMNLTKKVINYRETNDIKRNDFLQILINLKNNKSIADDNLLNADKKSEKLNLPPALTYEEIAAQTFVFFVAGYETSSSALTLCLYELSKNQEIQKKLRQEIKTMLNSTNGEITYDEIMSATYLDMVISETLRKYPALGILNRKCNTRNKIPGTNLIIEEDNRVIISVYGIHHDPEYYPDPEKFDPERFSDENKAKRPNFTYFPFGDGPRICIGLRFGLMQVKIALVSILNNYQVTFDPKTFEPIEFNVRSFTLNPKSHIYLQLNKCIL